MAEYEIQFIDVEDNITFVEPVVSVHESAKEMEILHKYVQAQLRYYGACRAKIVKIK